MLSSFAPRARRHVLSSFMRLMSTAPKHGDMYPTSGTVPVWANVDPWAMSESSPHKMSNLVDGKWTDTQQYTDVVDPMNGETFLKAPDASGAELEPFLTGARSCPKSGMHNPLKNPERYLMYGEVMHKAAIELSSNLDFYARLISRVMPKSYYQAWYESKVSADFLKNFAGDNPRFISGGTSVSGDHLGQESRNYRWPYGPVAIVSPFNFPLEIPSLQLMGALMMGNRPLLKGDSAVSVVMEQYVRMLIHCGMPATDMDLINCSGPTMGEVLSSGAFRTTQFTGSSKVAEHLSEELSGKVKIEDAGYDWKILGPDVMEEEYVAWTSDQDAYACSGQKCSAQSILFAHSNWVEAGLLGKLEGLATKRNLTDLSIGPVMTHTTESILDHTARLLKIPGAKLLFGGKELTNHSIPKKYGAVEPTAVFVPLEQILSEEHFATCTTEVFGPFQVVTEYNDNSLPNVLEACERMSHHLTAAVVSNDPIFTTKVLGNTVNGTSYAGIRARTTGAPQNHWFGPAGDPRGAGIGTPYAIQLVWSCHREVIHDVGPIPSAWSAGRPS